MGAYVYRIDLFLFGVNMITKKASWAAGYSFGVWPQFYSGSFFVAVSGRSVDLSTL